MLGPVRLWVAGSEVPLRGWQCPTLLALLVFNPGEHHRRQLVSELWGEAMLDGGRREDSALARLYVATRKLRIAMKDHQHELLVTDRGKRTLELSRTAEIAIDFDDFRDELNSGHPSAARRRIDSVHVCQGLEVPVLNGCRDLVRHLAADAQLRTDLTDPARRISRIVDSDLVVVKAILLGWGLEDILQTAGYSHRYVHLPWGNQILATLDSGRVDFAIYNHMETQTYLRDNPSSTIRVLGSFGHSMGGKNFYILTHCHGRWADVSGEDFLRSPAGATFLVPKHSDMYHNLLSVLELEEDALRKWDIHVIHAPTTTIELAGHDRDSLLVGGQNLRFEALASRNYTELVSFDTLRDVHRGRLRAASENALLSRVDVVEGLSAAGITDLWSATRNQFNDRWGSVEHFDALLEDLCLHTGFTERPALARHILYETYRFGSPGP